MPIPNQWPDYEIPEKTAMLNHKTWQKNRKESEPFCPIKAGKDSKHLPMPSSVANCLI